MAKAEKRISIFGNQLDKDIPGRNALMDIAYPGWDEQAIETKIIALAKHYKLEATEGQGVFVQLLKRVLKDCVKGFRVVRSAPKVGRRLVRNAEVLMEFAMAIDELRKDGSSIKAACGKYSHAHPEDKRSDRTLANHYGRGKNLLKDMNRLRKKWKATSPNERMPIETDIEFKPGTGKSNSYYAALKYMVKD